VTFQGKFCSGMREAALSLTKSLAQAVQETLVDFEVAVEKNNSKTTVQNGNLHPFTIEVINYVKGLFELVPPFPSCYTFLTNEYYYKLLIQTREIYKSIS
jgi:hypothetical protein